MIIFVILLISNDLFAMEKYLLVCCDVLLKVSLDSAMHQVGKIEKTNKNDGDVQIYQKAVGLKKGEPYCAAGVYWCFASAANDLGLSVNEISVVRTGLANKMYNEAKKKGTRVVYKAKKNDLIVWRKRNSYNGHIERIFEVGRAGWVKTVGFNVAGIVNNKQVEGVFIKKRNIYQRIQNLFIRGLIGFKGQESK